MLRWFLRICIERLKMLRGLMGGQGIPAIDPRLKDQNLILLITEANLPRIERMLYHLQPLREEKFVLICSRQKFNKAFFQRCPGVDVILTDSPWQVRSLVNQFKNLKLIHAFESRSLYAYFAMRAKPGCKVIFDFQDLYTNYTGDKNLPAWMRENILFERYCLKHADAFVAYSLELIPARKRLNLPKKKAIYFPFYLDDQEIIPAEVKSGEDIQIVYAGGIAALDRPISFNMRLTEEQLRGSNVFLHVFPSPMSGKDIIDSYHEYAKTHPHLIMHEPVPNNQMARALNQFDFGIVPFFKTVEYKSEAKYHYSSALKIFNYLEAGLPVIIAKDVVYQAWLIQHNHAGIVIDNEGFSNISNVLKEYKISHFGNSISALQSRWKLSKQITKINTLYNELIDTNNQ